MLHVFISYAHEDGSEYRDSLINQLAKRGFSKDDFWYDERDIEVGEEWRTEIDKALRESFIVLVILTPKAIRSHFVTYEWARALGDGIKVVPLRYFEKVSSIPQKHPLVERKQYEDCRNGIPQQVIEDVKKSRELPPDTVHINGLIQQAVRNTRVMSRVSLWLFHYAHIGIGNEDHCMILMGKTASEIKKSQLRLTKLMIYASHAFTSRQKRKCRELTENLRLFWEMFRVEVTIKVQGRYLPRMGFDLGTVQSMNDFRTSHLETLFDYFTDENDETNYRAVDGCLNAISEAVSLNNIQFKLSKIEISQVYGAGTDEATAIIQAIEKVQDSLQAK